MTGLMAARPKTGSGIGDERVQLRPRDALVALDEGHLRGCAMCGVAHQVSEIASHDAECRTVMRG